MTLYDIHSFCKSVLMVSVFVGFFYLCATIEYFDNRKAKRKIWEDSFDKLFDACGAKGNVRVWIVAIVALVGSTMFVLASPQVACLLGCDDLRLATDSFNLLGYILPVVGTIAYWFPTILYIKQKLDEARRKHDEELINRAMDEAIKRMESKTK